MTTNNWMAGGGIVNFGIEGDADPDWSLGVTPTSTQDAVVNTGSSGLLLAATSDEDVNSISLGSNDALLIDDGSDFTALSGTGSNVNNGAINIDSANLLVGNASSPASFDNSNSGSIVLSGNSTSGTAAFIVNNGSVNLNGVGSVEMTIGDPVGDNLITGNFLHATTLTNETEDISGTGTIGGGLNFLNEEKVETNNDTSSNGGILVIEGSTAGGSFTNADGGLVEVDNAGTLVFGVDGFTSSIVNSGGTIGLDNSGAITGLQVAGNVTISGPASSDNRILLDGSDVSGDQIVSDGKTASLTLVNQTLKGAGLVGDAHLALNLQSTLVDANIPGGEIVISALSADAASTLEADGSILSFAGPVNSAGKMEALDGGEIETIFAIAGSGAVDIGQNGILATAAKISGDVTFRGGDAELKIMRIFTTGGSIGGEIVGAATSDSIDDSLVSFAAGVHAVWQQTSSSGGTLSLYGSGANRGSFNLAGQYNSLDFAVSNDGSGGALITVQNTPSYPDNPGDNDEWILSNGNWVESAGPGSHPSGYNVAGIGDWTGGGTDGILWFDPSTGNTDEWQLSNTQWSASVDLGAHPGNYQISGAGGFFGNGISDVLWTSATGGNVQTDIWELGSNGQWINSVSPGPHPAGYTVSGTGDWTGDGTDGILWYDSSTGDIDEWQLSNGQWAKSVDLGSHPGSGWTIAGVGDFFDNGRDDVLWTNASGSSVQTDIWELGTNGQWINSVSPGDHPAGYQVAAVGDFTGTGTSDILWYDASTGDVDEWQIVNGQWSASVDFGTHPGNFQIAGVGDFNGDGTKDVLWHASS